MYETWEEAVLRIISSAKGAISLQEIYAAMESRAGPGNLDRAISGVSA